MAAPTDTWQITVGGCSARKASRTLQHLPHQNDHRGGAISDLLVFLVLGPRKLDPAMSDCTIGTRAIGQGRKY